LYGFIPSAGPDRSRRWVAEPEVLPPDAVGDVQIGAGDRGRSGAREHHLDLVDLLARDLERVQERRGGDDRGSVLVVVEDRDVQGRLQALLDLEAFRRLDVLEVDPAEGRGQRRTVSMTSPTPEGRADVEDVDVGSA
jgi:hypothetical protein